MTVRARTSATPLARNPVATAATSTISAARTTTSWRSLLLIVNLLLTRARFLYRSAAARHTAA